VRGDHDVPEQDIRRRFERSWINFNLFYKHLADSRIIFDTSDNQPVFLDESE
jgi:predicted ABC-type ATPase